MTVGQIINDGIKVQNSNKKVVNPKYKGYLSYESEKEIKQELRLLRNIPASKETCEREKELCKELETGIEVREALKKAQKELIEEYKYKHS